MRAPLELAPLAQRVGGEGPINVPQVDGQLVLWPPPDQTPPPSQLSQPLLIAPLGSGSASQLNPSSVMVPHQWAPYARGEGASSPLGLQNSLLQMRAGVISGGYQSISRSRAGTPATAIAGGAGSQRGRASSSSSSDEQRARRRSRRRTSSRRHGRSRSRRRSRRSRSSRWRSPSSSDESPERSRRRRRTPTATSVQRGDVGPTSVDQFQDTGNTMFSAQGEYPYVGVWSGVGSAAPGEPAHFKKVFVNPKLLQVPEGSKITPPAPDLYKGGLFCGVPPLGSHLEVQVKELIWANSYVDIWSLISTDQHSVDRERRPGEKFYDRKPKVAKTINNWLQAFAVLGCVMGQRHPERCSELFIYMDSIYSSYKAHGGSAWWKYDEDFRRRLDLQPHLGWGVKATDSWLRLMMAQRFLQPFPGGAAAPGSQSTGAVAVRRPGTCWLFNDGFCKYHTLCKYKHECSVCGGPHTATKCNKPAQKAHGAKPGSQEHRDTSERHHDGAVAKQVPQ
ncbi:uncharacterized protein ACNLHF_014087 [Anomaloglossus baeobatrachus]